MFLAVETTTDIFSVSLGDGESPCLTLRFPGRKHSERLIPAVCGIIESSGIELSGIKALAAGSGPGSFTGIRIGLSFAAAFSQVMGIPLYSVSSLDLAGRQLRNPVIGAFKGKYYWAGYDETGLRKTPYSLIDEARRKELDAVEVDVSSEILLNEAAVLWAGGDRRTWRDIITHYVMDTVYRKKKEAR